jgi:cyanase
MPRAIDRVDSAPTDPLIYRWYEIVGVYGETIKELIHEKFGDGIMSAIDVTLDIDKQEDPKGDRVVVTLNGKFLPYKSWSRLVRAVHSGRSAFAWPGFSSGLLTTCAGIP